MYLDFEQNSSTDYHWEKTKQTTKQQQQNYDLLIATEIHTILSYTLYILSNVQWFSSLHIKFLCSLATMFMSMCVCVFFNHKNVVKIRDEWDNTVNTRFMAIKKGFFFSRSLVIQ